MRDDVNYLPTAEFRDFLEDEVVRTYRRSRGLRRFRAVAVMLACITLGSGASIAAAQIRDGARRDSLLEAASAELAMAGLRLELARAAAADVSAKVQSGLLAQASLAAVEADLRTAEARAMQAKANVEEIRASSQAPRDELNAPLVDGRDFVLERLRLELMSAQQRLTAAERQLDDVARRARVGIAEDQARLAAELEVTQARAALGVLAQRQQLRRQWLEQRTPADGLVRQLRQAELRYDAMVAQKALRLAEERLAQARQQHAVAAVDEIEVLKAELEMRERQLELQAIARQLQEIERNPPR